MSNPTFMPARIIENIISSHEENGKNLDYIDALGIGFARFHEDKLGVGYEIFDDPDSPNDMVETRFVSPSVLGTYGSVIERCPNVIRFNDVNEYDSPLIEIFNPETDTVLANIKFSNRPDAISMKPEDGEYFENWDIENVKIGEKTRFVYFINFNNFTNICEKERDEFMLNLVSLSGYKKLAFSDASFGDDSDKFIDVVRFELEPRESWENAQEEIVRFFEKVQEVM